MYLSAAAIAALVPQRKVHFLNPAAERRTRSLGDATGLERLGVHLTEAAPGARSTEFRVHHYEEACIYVLSGCGTATLGQAVHRIGPGPGDFIGCPTNGVAHEMIDDGDDPRVPGDRAAPRVGGHRLSASRKASFPPWRRSASRRAGDARAPRPLRRPS
jgi:uncharacterized cupin superfamily protein